MEEIISGWKSSSASPDWSFHFLSLSSSRVISLPALPVYRRARYLHCTNVEHVSLLVEIERSVVEFAAAKMVAGILLTVANCWRRFSEPYEQQADD